MRPVVVLAFLMALAPRCAWSEPPVAASGRLAVLTHAIRQGRGPARVPNEQELARAKADLLVAHGRFSAQLAEVPDGQSTADELDLAALAEELQRPMPDLDALARADAKLRRNSPGAKGDDFTRLRDALRHYVRLTRASTLDDLPRQFTAWMDRLDAAFTRYSSDRSPENLSAVAEAYDWLLAHDQARDVLEQVRREAVHVNHRMRFSADFLDRLVRQRVVRPLSSDEQSDGAQVRVRGTLDGKLNSTLLPDEARAVVHVGFRGIGTSNITAVKGIATVRARGQTQITAAQPVYLTAAGFAVGAPSSVVRHRTTGSTVSLSIRCRVLRRWLTRVAGKVVGRQQPASDRKVSQRTRRQVEEQLRTESTRMAGQGNQTLESFGLLSALGPNPASRLQLRTTADYLEWLGRYAGETQFASPAGPPDAHSSDHAVLFQVHESAVNNSQRFIAGRLVNEADFREAVFSTFGLVPSDDDDLAGRIPASIVFAEDDPLQVAIRDGQVWITVRLDAIRGDRLARQAGPYTVKTAYRIETGEGPVKIVRTGPVEIEPSGSTETEALRQILSRFFVGEAVAGGGQPPLAAVLAPAVLRLDQCSLVDGWLTLALKLDEGATGD